MTTAATTALPRYWARDWWYRALLGCSSSPLLSDFFHLCQRVIRFAWRGKARRLQVLVHVGAVCGCIATCVAVRVIHIRLLVFVAQGIYVIDALTGKFAIFL